MCKTELLERSLVGMFLLQFYVVYLETSNVLMPAARELMMQRRLLILIGVQHAVQIIRVILCLLVLNARGSAVLQGSHIMNESGTHQEVMRDT